MYVYNVSHSFYISYIFMSCETKPLWCQTLSHLPLSPQAEWSHWSLTDKQCRSKVFGRKKWSSTGSSVDGELWQSWCSELVRLRIEFSDSNNNPVIFTAATICKSVFDITCKLVFVSFFFLINIRSFHLKIKGWLFVGLSLSAAGHLCIRGIAGRRQG